MLLFQAASDNWEKEQFKQNVVNSSHKGTGMDKFIYILYVLFPAFRQC